jgi:hypothetical protein
MPLPHDETIPTNLPARIGTMIGNTVVGVMVASLLWAIIAKFV